MWNVPGPAGREGRDGTGHCRCRRGDAGGKGSGRFAIAPAPPASPAAGARLSGAAPAPPSEAAAAAAAGERKRGGSGGAPARAGVSIPRGRWAPQQGRWAPQRGRREDPAGPGELLWRGGHGAAPHPRGRSEGAGTPRAGLLWHIAAPSRPGSQHLLRPPRKILRSVECGFGLTRLLVKLSAWALRFPGQLECLVFGLLYLVVFYV